jgi:hypothetical protein
MSIVKQWFGGYKGEMLKKFKIYYKIKKIIYYVTLFMHIFLYLYL